MYIVKIKESEKYRLFGSLPILCKRLDLTKKDYSQFTYNFSIRKKMTFEDDNFLIIKAELEKGGSTVLKD